MPVAKRKSTKDQLEPKSIFSTIHSRTQFEWLRIKGFKFVMLLNLIFVIFLLTVPLFWVDVSTQKSIALPENVSRILLDVGLGLWIVIMVSIPCIFVYKSRQYSRKSQELTDFAFTLEFVDAKRRGEFSEDVVEVMRQTL